MRVILLKKHKYRIKAGRKMWIGDKICTINSTEANIVTII
jgi:hypothetical protein